MNETMNFTLNLLNRSQNIVYDIKDVCVGIFANELFFIVSCLLIFNFLSFLLWKKIKPLNIDLFGKNFELVYFIPVVNYACLVIILLYVYNGVAGF